MAPVLSTVRKFLYHLYIEASAHTEARASSHRNRQRAVARRLLEYSLRVGLDTHYAKLAYHASNRTVKSNPYRVHYIGPRQLPVNSDFPL